MAANSSAHPARAGFNQSGGAYFYIMTTLETRAAAGSAPSATGTYINTLSAPGSNSGGAWIPPTLGSNTFSNVAGATNATTASTLSGFVGRFNLLKDMGKTVVSSGRVFRKFAAVGTAAQGGAGVAAYNSSLGVLGGAGSAPNAGYGSFYLEVGRDGQGSATPAPIARYA